MKIVLALGAALLAAAPEVRGETPAYDGRVRPVLAQHCFSCHNAKLTFGKLDLQAIRADSDPAVWDKVREKVASRKMPPPGQAALSDTDLTAVTSWIDSLLKTSSSEPEANPGRVMARRLNRTEYNNTIRDLLNVSARPADEFPVDDSGYGFDNVADVLSISPMLMEKYMAAAQRISRLAVFGETYPPKPTRLVRLLNRRSPDAADVLSGGKFGSYLPYSMRGAMYGSWTFPVDGEYEFRLRIANFRELRPPANLTPEERRQRAREMRGNEDAARKAVPPRKLVLTVDGSPVITEVVEGLANVDYDRGEFVARAPVKAGERLLRASYPELADLADPRENINPDKRRGLFVDYLEIVGPYSPSAAPPPSYRSVFVCGHDRGKHQAGQCAPRVVKSLLERAYRRPVSAAELQAKVRLVEIAQKEGDSFEEGVRLALEAVLASPDFLFRIERDAKGQAGATRPLNDYELASRLSYWLWSSMPDDQLRAEAAKGLRRPGVLEAQVRRMLVDKKSWNLVENFAAQWLQLRNLGRTKPDVAKFPTFDDELLDAMRRETSLFVETIFREDRSVLDFIDAPFTFVNGLLARHYGITGVNGEEFRRVELDGEQRSGLLTQGAILTVSSYPTRTSPPVRGKWVLENLLGAPPPPPPPDVPVLDESTNTATLSLRARLEQHRKDPSCSACHNMMDPIGFGLESYDAVGSWRTHDGKVAIDTSGVLPDGRSFQGAKDLKKILRSQSDAFARNFAEKLLTFALGRGLERYDRAALEEIVRGSAKTDYRFSSFVMGIVNSQPFLMRRAEGGKS